MFLAMMGVDKFIFFVLEFLVAAGLVLYAGSRLAHYGDAIADNSAFSHGWIGFILLASITSLPELMTGISSTAIVGSVDLVLSNTIGSNAFNVIILALLFLFGRRTLIQVGLEDMISGFAGLFLLGLVAVFLLAQSVFINPWLSVGASVALFLAYLLVVMVVFKTGGLKEETAEPGEKNPETRVGLKFAAFSLIIIGAAVWMTKTADLIAVTPILLPASQIVLGQTFVGALMLSIATSLPELSVTFSAARMGNVQMAVGNIFGSNIFNLFILPISALFYRGNFWKDAHPANLVLVVLVLLVTGIMGTDLVYRTRLRRQGVTLLALLALLVWIGGMVVTFFTGNAGA